MSQNNLTKLPPIKAKQDKSPDSGQKPFGEKTDAFAKAVKYA